LLSVKRSTLLHILAFCTLVVSAQTKIEIISADELVYDQEVGRYQRCIGNVEFKQGNMHMYCDSARFYEVQNRVEAFGDIYINQPDTLDLWGDYLDYDGDKKEAKLTGKVKLTDGEMTLRTRQLNYNLGTQIGYYSTKSYIDNGEDQLESIKGTYYSETKEFFFKDSVKLTNPEYTMTSDTLRYNTETTLASFYGPTFIRSEENTIFCNYGWYNTDKEISQFSKGAYIEGEENKLTADSMVYYRNTGWGYAYGNIVLIDTVQEVTIKGDTGVYQRFDKRTVVTGNPLAIKKMDDDSLFLWADTLRDETDTVSNKRFLHAYRQVKMFKSDVQSVADSLVYNFTDSTITEYYNPCVWTDSSQITGDTIIIYRNNDGIDRIRAFDNAFIIEKDSNGFYNQIAGKRLIAFFTSGKINKVNVLGNGQSIYYAQQDSASYAGVNDVVCGNMIIYFNKANKVNSITFLSQPKATFYPLSDFPSSESKLPGFDWRTVLRPEAPEINK
jgi:lipopolysaccharide export system protein LptA